jgi:hypothetical protein
MKKSVTLNLKEVRNYTSGWFAEIIINRLKLILTVLAVFGLWCGTRLYISYNANISELMNRFSAVFSSRSIIKSFIVLLVINLMPILLSFLNGFFVFGMPFSMICPCLSGVLTGAVNAWIFSDYRLNGVFFSLLSVIPFAVAITIMLLISCNESIILSGQLSKSVFLKETGDRGEVRDFFIRHIIIIAVTAVISFLQVILIINLCGKLLV